MVSITVHQEIINKLFSTYKTNGYVTEEVVFDTIFEHNLPLDEVDNVCDQLLSMGVIIDDSTSENLDGYEEVDYDRSKTDYEKLFNKIETIDDSLIPFIDEIRQIKPPQHREWQNLIPQAKNGNLFAKQRILEMYLRVVIKIAFSYHQKYKIPLAETIQDGCVGLVIALDKYEVGRQDKFSTYAPWWIRQNILRKAPTVNPLVYFPVHVKDKLFSIYEILENYYGNQWDCNNICSEMLKAVSEKLDCTENEAEDYINYLNSSFDSIEEQMKKGECMFCDSGVAEEQMFIDLYNKELKSVVAKIFGKLNLREEKIILLRFGFIDGKEWTLEEIGNELGVTRERIRQIEKKTLGKLRRSKMLKRHVI